MHVCAKINISLNEREKNTMSAVDFLLKLQVPVNSIPNILVI